MGASYSVPVLEGRLTGQLLGLLENKGTGIKVETAQEIIKTVLKFSPWFLHAGGFNITDWDQVKADLQNALKEQGPQEFPMAIFSLWRLVRDALLNDDVRVKEQLESLNKTLEEIQEVESVSSIKSFQEQEVLGTDSIRKDIEEEEEILEKEIALIKKKLEKEERKEANGDVSMRPPPLNPHTAASAPMDLEAEIREIRDRLNNLSREKQIEKRIYPVVENIDQQGQRARQHNPLAFKDIKQLKEAVVDYGAHAPFTVALLESFAELNLIPNDWMQLCRACLSGGDYLLWRGEMQENCKKTADKNAEAGFPQNNLDKLTGEGQYASLEAQIAYDPAIYAQIAAAAVKAWKTLPNKGSREQLSKIFQGNSEPYSEFIDRLIQVGSRIFGDVDSAMPVVKHLAFENANKFCQQVLRPHRDGDLNDFIRLCGDIDGTHVIGQVIVSALKEGQDGARPRNYFQCGRSGLLKRNYLAGIGAVNQARI